ncbi:MAG: FAD-dependent oxidoreductase [Sterolibacterium sp.]|jgi:NADH dehydrogenase FAD-containing subunit
MKRLVLAGGGHAHLHVLKALAASRWPDVEVILVSPHARQVYSGMLPGWIAGHYPLADCAAALTPLARAAGVRFIQDNVVGVDAKQQIVRCALVGDIHYDVLSLDTGADMDTSTLAATGAVLLPIRPLERFLVKWDRQIATFAESRQARVAVVGAGAAGVELALAIRYRLASLVGSTKSEVFLIEGNALLNGHGDRVIERVTVVLARHGIQRLRGRAAGAESGLVLSDGRTLSVDCVVAATNVTPVDWIAKSGLALARDGFVAVGNGQQSVSHANVFAAGDVATRLDRPHAKSGVYAVRAGPDRHSVSICGAVLPVRRQQRICHSAEPSICSPPGRRRRSSRGPE